MSFAAAGRGMFALALALWALTSHAAQTGASDAAQGAERAAEPPGTAVVLTISGKVGTGGGDAAYAFDMPTLSRFTQHTIVTHTPWYAQARRFTGPLLRDVLAAAAAQGTTLHAVALNDYSVDLPYSDVLDYDVVLARLIDSKPITVRDKGPLFIIYPFDAHAQLRNAVYYSRSVWQLKGIEVR